MPMIKMERNSNATNKHHDLKEPIK